MNKYVYKILDSNDNVVWVGETKNPKERLYGHRHSRQSKLKHIKNEIRMEIISIHDNRKDAWNEQIKWQKFYGLETDNEKLSKEKTPEQIQKSYLKTLRKEDPIKYVELKYPKIVECLRNGCGFRETMRISGHPQGTITRVRKTLSH
jgi:predicted GIY-YIG superfamily endonuclease